MEDYEFIPTPQLEESLKNYYMGQARIVTKNGVLHQGQILSTQADLFQFIIKFWWLRVWDGKNWIPQPKLYRCPIKFDYIRYRLTPIEIDIVGYAWMLILRSEGLVNTALLKMGLIAEPLPLLYNGFAVGIGLLYSYLPFMILPIYAALERMDWRVAEAAEDLYAGRRQVLTKIIIPLAMPGIIAGCVLVFIPAIGSFLASDLLGGGKQMMIGNMIQMQFGFSRNWPLGSAASVAVMVLVMLGLILLARKSRGPALVHL